MQDGVTGRQFVILTEYRFEWIGAAVGANIVVLTGTT